MLKKITVSFLILTLILTSFIACGRGGQSNEGETTSENPIVIKFGHTDTETRSAHVAALEFQKYMEENTDGRVKVEIYPNGQLGDDEELLKGVKLGTIQLYNGAGSVGTVAGPQANVIELPFVYNSIQDWETGSFEKGGLEIFNKTLEGTGLTCIDFGYNGSKNLLSKTKVYKSVDELQGFKVRVTPTDLNLALWKAAGANPTPVSFGEVYTALTQGTVEGVDHTLGVILDMKFYEAAKYITLTNHIYQPYTYVTSQSFLDSLPEDIKATFIDGIHLMAEQQRDLEYKNEEGYMKALTDAGVEIVEMPADARQELREKMLSVYEFQKEVSGADIVDEFLATGGNE